MTTAYLNMSYSADILSRKPLKYAFYRFRSYHSFFYRSNQFSDYISDHYSFPLFWPCFEFDSLWLYLPTSRTRFRFTKRPIHFYPSTTPLFPWRNITPDLSNLIYKFHFQFHFWSWNPIPIYISSKKKYKPVHLKVEPVIGALPDKFRIVRNIIGDPLKYLPTLLIDPPKFKPTGRYTQETKDKFDKAHHGFLWPPERHLLHYFIMIHNNAFTWENSEHGHFREDFFPPVDIPVIPHKPWIQCNIPIPPGLYEELCNVVKQKLDAGVFEPSHSSYRSRWFCVLKKDGKWLEPLNQVTIAHSRVPPFTEQLTEEFAGCTCNVMMDQFIGYDKCALAPSSRDLTIF